MKPPEKKDESKEKSPYQKKSRLRVFSVNIGRLALAAFFAVVMWFTANYESDLEKDVEIPINYLNLSEDFIISNRPYLPSYIKLRIKGTRSQVSSVLKTNTSINIDLTDRAEGISSHEINPESVSLPRNVQIVRISPREIVLDIDTIFEKFVPIKLEMGPPPLGYRVEGEPETSPSTVSIKGPGKVMRDINEVKTIPVALAKEKTTFSVDVGLVSPDSRVTFPETQIVKATVRIIELEIEKTFKNLKAKIRNASEDEEYKMEPETVDIKFQGPRSLVNNLHGENIDIYADIKDVENFPEGDTKNFPLFHNYPNSDKIRVVEIMPGKVAITKQGAEE